jgi:hypothetical protein
MKSIKYIVAAVVCTFAFSCGAKYAKVKIKDANEKSAYVYGDLDGPAKQLKNTYPNATPETVEKANNFRALVESELVSAKK